MEGVAWWRGEQSVSISIMHQLEFRPGIRAAATTMHNPAHDYYVERFQMKACGKSPILFRGAADANIGLQRGTKTLADTASNEYRDAIYDS